MRLTTETRAIVELQHVNVKLLLQLADGVELERVIPIFHRWIQGQIRDELLIDVADYRHVRSGSGVVLIGHEADYSLDESDGRIGLRYNRKAPVPGGNEHRLEQAARSALEALSLLERETELEGKLGFRGQEVEISINDRLLAPNTPETRLATEADFQAFFDKLFGSGAYALGYPDDARRLFGVYARARHTSTTIELLEKLDGQTGWVNRQQRKGIAGF